MYGFRPIFSLACVYVSSFGKGFSEQIEVGYWEDHFIYSIGM